MTFNYRKYKADGKKDSCMFYAHPDIANDEFVKSKLQEVVDYVRDNYDLDIFTKIWGVIWKIVHIFAKYFKYDHIKYL